MPIDTLAACEEAGLRVPGDIRFIGYDDIAAAARSRPSLSTVRVDKEALGREAVQCLLEGRLAAGDTLMPVELLVRESSRALAADVGAVTGSRRKKAAGVR